VLISNQLVWVFNWPGYFMQYSQGHITTILAKNKNEYVYVRNRALLDGIVRNFFRCCRHGKTFV